MQISPCVFREQGICQSKFAKMNSSGALKRPDEAMRLQKRKTKEQSYSYRGYVKPLSSFEPRVALRSIECFIIEAFLLGVKIYNLGVFAVDPN